MTRDYRKEFAEDFITLDKRYKGVESFIQKMPQGEVRSLIINGPPGVGKTHSVTTYLEKYAKGNYKVITGHLTLLSLYAVLYDYRSAGQIVVLDDVDSIFGKVEGLNILKAAMDTNDQRKIHWETSGGKLNTMGLPLHFYFEGGVILISNLGFGGGHSKLVSHLSALKDRSYCIPVAEKGEDSLFKQVCYMVLERGMMTNLGVDIKDQPMLLQYIDENRGKLNTMSLRTVTKLAKIFKMNTTDWRTMADQGLLRI
jgi:hypothetical protein